MERTLKHFLAQNDTCSRYILVVVCTFTRWVELYATIDATSQSTAESLLQHFGRFGGPRQLRSDRGPHFIAEVIEQFLTLLGVEHELTLAYSKEENAIVERFNKEINRHLRALTFDNLSSDNYKQSLPFVQRILNANYSVLRFLHLKYYLGICWPWIEEYYSNILNV